MPKPFSRNFIAELAAYKGAKAKTAKFAPASSSYGDVNQSDYSGPFGSGQSRIETYTDPVTGKPAKRLTTNSLLNPTLQYASDTASSGLNNNLGYINQNPTDQLNGALGGNNPWFNVLNDQQHKAEQQAAGRIALRAQGTGNLNSTSAGAALGTLDSLAQEQRNQNLLNSILSANQLASSNVGTNLGALGGLANLVYPMGNNSAATLQNALNQNNQVNLQNSAQQNSINVENAKMQNAQQQANQQSIGNMIGTGIGALGTIGGAALGGPIGAQLGGALGKWAGGAIGGGGLGGGNGVPSLVGALGQQKVI